MKWEYLEIVTTGSVNKVFQVNGERAGEPALGPYVHRLGLGGWEMVGLAGWSGLSGMHIWFKRPLPEKAASTRTTPVQAATDQPAAPAKPARKRTPTAKPTEPEGPLLNVVLVGVHRGLLGNKDMTPLVDRLCLWGMKRPDAQAAVSQPPAVVQSTTSSALAELHKSTLESFGAIVEIRTAAIDVSPR